jgi:hypothetical protein
MPVALTTSFRDLRARVGRTTPRERLLLASLGVGALLYSLVSASEFRHRQEDMLAEALADRAQAHLARSSATRTAASAPDQMALEDMQSWGLAAANVSIAQVRIENRLLEAATAAELANAQITTDDDLVEVGPTQWLHAEVETDLNWTSTFAFLEEVGRMPSGFRIVEFGFDVQPERGRRNPEEFRPPRGRIRMTLGFPVEIEQGVAAP